MTSSRSIDPQAVAPESADDDKPVAPAKLTRITTEFQEREDRILLTGETDADEALCLWLTRRMLVRLLPKLFDWLQREVPQSLAADAIQGFRQQSATAALEVQEPVRADPDARQWLVTSVDVSLQGQQVQLVFRGDQPDEAVSLSLRPMPMRQWLGVLHTQFRRADWAAEIWPGWMLESLNSSADGGKSNLMH
ncbi:MAG: hypothetical protein ACO3BH_11635 [Quisquiliibacterium sp.]